jgi:Leucine-rich repeat (LRR) protein
MDWLLPLIIFIIIFTGILLYTVFCNCRCENGKNICGLGFFGNFNFIGSLLIAGLILGLLIYFTIFVTKKEDEVNPVPPIPPTPPVPPEIDYQFEFEVNIDNNTISPNFIIQSDFESSFIVINWGDGTEETINDLKNNNIINHLYSSNGLYNVRVIDSSEIKLMTIGTTNFNKITSIFFKKKLNLLQTLNVQNNKLKSLDLSLLDNLKVVQCFLNDIETINVENLINLEQLASGVNKLTVINLSFLEKIKFLDVSRNQINSLNLNSISSLQLQELTINNNNLNSLDFSNPNLISLKKVECSNNLLGNIDVTYLSNLEILICFNNPILSSNISIINLTKLNFLQCGNCNLNNLDLTGCINITYLEFVQNNISESTLVGLLSLTNLETFIFGQNNFVTIDLSSFKKLKIVYGQVQTLININLSTLPLLEDIILNSNDITTINISNSPKIINLDLENNNLAVNTVDTILNTLDTNGLNNGNLKLHLQTPSAPPSIGPPNGITAKSNLISKGWIVITD